MTATATRSRHAGPLVERGRTWTIVDRLAVAGEAQARHVSIQLDRPDRTDRLDILREHARMAKPDPAAPTSARSRTAD